MSSRTADRSPTGRPWGASSACHAVGAQVAPELLAAERRADASRVIDPPRPGHLGRPVQHRLCQIVLPSMSCPPCSRTPSRPSPPGRTSSGGCCDRCARRVRVRADLQPHCHVGTADGPGRCSWLHHTTSGPLSPAPSSVGRRPALERAVPPAAGPTERSRIARRAARAWTFLRQVAGSTSSAETEAVVLGPTRDGGRTVRADHA